MASFKDVISSAMPFLGSLLGGPIGGKAGEAIAEILTGKKDASQDEITAALLGANAEKLIELKKIDEQYKEKILSTEVDKMKIASDDRDSARKMNIENSKVNSLNMPSVLSLIIIPGFFLILLLIMVFPIDNASRDVIEILIGFLGGSLGQVTSFYFGTTQEKTKLLGELSLIRKSDEK